MKENFGEYYLGLDMGTSSVGWAVTDLKYNLLKFHRKQMWGINLFDEANTAEERRLFRGARRRLGRRRERTRLLEEIFSEEICKVDPSFYLRMKESKYYLEDKKVEERFSLFAEKEYTDKQYHEEYPTIYHLRKALIEGDKQYDIRLYYLAIHHIIKHRGHFLFQGQNMEKATSFEVVFNELIDLLRDNYDMTLTCSDMVIVSNIVKDRTLGITAKNSALNQVLNFSNVISEREDSEGGINAKVFTKMLSGGTVNLKDLFMDPSLDELEVNKICFSSGSYDDNVLVLQGEIPENIYLIEKMKAIYDWGILANIIGDEKYISYAKISTYGKHKSDLIKLKRVMREKGCFTQEDYKNMFIVIDSSKTNYANYIGKSSCHGKKKPTEKRKDISKESFCKYILKYLNKIPENERDEDVEYLIREANLGTILPKQVSTDNGVIPYQLHLAELEAILKNLVRDYPELNKKDESGFTPKEKIEKLFTFRIPYYVGPLNDAHANKTDVTRGNCWIVKKQDTKVLPWNFDEVVDKEKSAQRFIRRMTNKCTYLVGEDVLPKDSLLYSRFMLLNELNNLKIDQEKISYELKQKLLKDIFENENYKGKITAKKLVTYLQQQGLVEKNENVEISGIDGEFKTSLTSYKDMKKIFGTKLNSEREMIEDIIVSIVLFGDDRFLLKTRLQNAYVKTGRMNEEELKQVVKKRYVGWGRLSEKFLCGIEGTDKETGEHGTIINLLENTNNNLMQLLSDGFTFHQEMDDYNNELLGDSNHISYDMIDELYVSPSVKRMIWQTLRVVKDVTKIIGHEPKKVFVEMAREKTKDGPKDSRKAKLMSLYKAMKAEGRQWAEEIDKLSESDLRSIKRFLYFTQMGKCMYCGKSIDLEELMTTDSYDRDHIYPQSKTKDDSLDNLVLVCKSHNAAKSDSYPISADIRNNMETFWKTLLKNNLISKTKYERLTRRDPLTQEELAGFIARQLVETRQSTKAVAEVMQKVFKDTEVVYAKASNVSEFRRGKDAKIDGEWKKINEFIKVRDVNDYHHAQDAYLNIVVGNVYNTKFTKSPITFIKDASHSKYSLNHMFDFEVKRGDTTAWIPGNDGTMRTVKEVMNQNLSKPGKIQFTRYASEKKGGLFDQMLMKKGKGQIKIKEGDERLSIEKYGGYNKASVAYFMLVESDGKKARKRTLEAIPMYLAKRVEENQQVAIEYLTKPEQGLVNPRIIMPKIKINAMLKVNGYPVHISGKTGKQIILKNAVQLCLPSDVTSYMKKIAKYVTRNAVRKDKATLLPINEYDGMNEEDNLRIYDILLDKHENTIYKNRTAGQVETLRKGREKFIKLSIEEQVVELNEVLHLFQCKPLTSDLKLIGGSGKAGSFKIGNELTKLSSIKLINQSPSGLLENEVDLLTL